MTPAGFPHSEILRINACLRLLDGFSQLTASFFGVWCLGIRPVLL